MGAAPCMASHASLTWSVVGARRVAVGERSRVAIHLHKHHGHRMTGSKHQIRRLYVQPQTPKRPPMAHVLGLRPTCATVPVHRSVCCALNVTTLVLLPPLCPAEKG